MVTYQQAWVAFHIHLKQLNMSASTLKQYALDGRQFIAYTKVHNEPHLTATYYPFLVQYVQHLEETYPKETSYNRKVACLRRFFKFARLREWVDDECYLALLTPKKIPKEIIPALTEGEIQQIGAVWERYLSYADSEDKYFIAKRNHLITTTILTLGCKPSELVRMQWHHLHYTEGFVRLLSGKGYRDVEVNALYLQLMQAYENEKPNDSPYIWQSETNIKGNPITVKTVERIFQTISKEIGITVRATDLRYAAIQRAMKDGDYEQAIARFGYARKWVLQDRQRRLK